MNAVAKVITAVALVISGSEWGGRQALAQGAATVTGDARVDRLLGQMTLQEKRGLIHDGREDPRTYQGQAGYIGGVPRLGIPGLRLADGPPGVLTVILHKPKPRPWAWPPVSMSASPDKTAW